MLYKGYLDVVDPKNMK